MPQKIGPRVICRDTSSHHPGTDLAAFVLSHPYNSRVGIAASCPDPQGHPTVQVPDPDSNRYSVVCNLSSFLSPGFLDREILGDGCEFIALCTGLDFSKCEAAGISNKALHLIVDSTAYEHLGLVGSQSKHSPGDGLQAGLMYALGAALIKLSTTPDLTDLPAADQYCIQVKLGSRAFRARQGFYHRVRVLQQPYDRLVYGCSVLAVAATCPHSPGYIRLALCRW